MCVCVCVHGIAACVSSKGERKKERGREGKRDEARIEGKEKREQEKESSDNIIPRLRVSVKKRITQ